MAVQDIQVGAGYLHGIAGSITFTPASGSDLGANMNHESRNFTTSWTEDEVISQDGTIVEQITATKERRTCKVRFMPKSTTRALAEAAVDTFKALTPNKVIVIAASTVSAFDGSYNLKPGMTIDETRDGKVVIDMTLEQYKDASGSFTSLALITG